MPNQYAQSHFLNEDLSESLNAACESLNDQIHGDIDLIFAFVSGQTAEEFDRCMPRIKEKTRARVVLGCSCETAIGGAYELEHAAAISLWAAKLPDAEITPMHLTYQRSGGDAAIVGWPSTTDGIWDDNSSLLLLGEPFGFPIDVLLERFNEDRPGVRIAGGMASGAQVPGESRLLLNDQTYEEGVVAIRISGTPIRMLVSQGCRPIGEPMIITASERNIIQSLGGKKALNVVYDLFQTLPTSEQQLFQNGLHVGRVINEYQDKFEYGDFLIRNVIGIDKETKSISIGDFVRPGQTVQFHIRDSQSASFEFQQILSRTVAKRPFSAGILFTCNGRGTHLFPDPHHDATCVAGANNSADGSTAAKVPLAGFFAAGEIGPVGNLNFLHGFTASLVVFD
ncbi:MAG: FIST N-terminal domain-containing protein [Mariniblastus sp.]|nr:FIST N-terminal domain-containing protein [Mariniblastus sp.]